MDEWRKAPSCSRLTSGPKRDSENGASPQGSSGVPSCAPRLHAGSQFWNGSKSESGRGSRRPRLLGLPSPPPLDVAIPSVFPPSAKQLSRYRDIVLLTNSGIFEKLRRYSVRNNAKAPLIASSRLFRQTGRHHQSTSPLPVGLHQRPSHCATFSPRPRLPSSGSLLHSFHSRSDLWGISLFPTSNPQPIVCSPFAVDSARPKLHP